MTRTIGIGLIGMGWMGEAHSRSYWAIPDRFIQSGIQPRLVVCADPVEARAQAAQRRFGFERYVTEWREVIADPEVEVVNVAAPNGMHLEINRAAAQPGKHIFCEKPVGKEPEETIESAVAPWFTLKTARAAFWRPVGSSMALSVICPLRFTGPKGP